MLYKVKIMEIMRWSILVKKNLMQKVHVVTFALYLLTKLKIFKTDFETFNAKTNELGKFPLSLYAPA